MQTTAEAFVQRLCTAGGSNLGYELCTPFAVDPLMFTQNTRAGITSVAWARDGGNVTTGDTIGFVQTWDVLTRSPWLTKFGEVGSTSAVASVAYSPDGRHLAVGFTNPADPASDQSVRVLDTATGELTLTLRGAGGSVAYSSDGTLASVQKGGPDKDAVQMWTCFDPLCLTLEVRQPGYIPNSVTYSPDGTHLAVALNAVVSDPVVSAVSDQNYGGLTIWNTATGKVTRNLGFGQHFVYSVTYSPTGSYLASCYDDGTAQIWNTATGERTRTLTHSNSGVYSVAYSPDGKHLASGGADGTVKIWNPVTGELTRTLGQKKGAVNSVAYRPDGRYLALGRTISPDTGEYGSLTIEPV